MSRIATIPRIATAATAAALALTLVGALPSYADPTGPGTTPGTAAPTAPTSAGQTGPAATTDGADGLTPTDTPTLTTGLHVVVDRAHPAAAAVRFLATHRARFGIDRPGTDLQPVDTAAAAGETAVRFQQRFHGVPVLGGQYVVRMRDRGDHAVVLGSSGHFFTGLDPAAAPTPSRDRAALLARRQLSRTVRHLRVRDRGPSVLPFGTGVLTRHVTVTGENRLTGLPVRRELFVAAGRVAPVLSYSDLDLMTGDVPVHTTGAGFHGPALPLDAVQQPTGDYALVDLGRDIVTRDAHGADVNAFLNGHGRSTLVTSPTTPFTTNKYGAVDAHWGAEQVYDFYAGLGRQGLDGNGGAIVSVVGVSDAGGPLPNAFWDGREMVYGTGGDGYRPFAASLDVVGHEMTHAVVQHTSGLLSFGQSGALNEAVADYFGNAIENQTEGIGPDSPLDGLMGQDLCLHRAPAQCADRNLDKVRTTTQVVGNGNDLGGVHANSQIVSGAFWAVRGILGNERADRVMYAVMTHYLTPLADFLDARGAVLAAAADPHVGNASADELARIRSAFDVRGVTEGWERTAAGLDGLRLYPSLSYGGQVSVGGDRWVITDAGPLGDRLPSVYAGSVRHSGHRRISPDSRAIYDVPSTDGRLVAWSASTFDGTTRVQVRPFSGGRVRTLARYRSALVLSTAVDHGTVAWHVLTRHHDQVVVRSPGGRTRTVVARRGHYLNAPDVLGRQMIWVDGGRRVHSGVQLMSMNLRNGHVRVLARVTAAGRLPAEIDQPTLTTRHVFFAADRGIRGLRAGIVRIDRSGRHRHTLVSDRSRHAPVLPQLAASDSAVTFGSYVSEKLLQVPARGGATRRVSCSHGLQALPAAGRGARVVWLDFSAGEQDLVTRARPAGRC